MKFEKRQFMCLYRMAPGGRDLMAGLIRRFCPSNFQVILFCGGTTWSLDCGSSYTAPTELKPPLQCENTGKGCTDKTQGLCGIYPGRSLWRGVFDRCGETFLTIVSLKHLVCIWFVTLQTCTRRIWAKKIKTASVISL